MTPWSLSSLAAAVALAVLCGNAVHAAAAGAATKRPHVLLVLADDLGWADVSFHGGTDAKSPTIDKLASEGLTLNNYYVQHICSPTRSALMSSKYPVHTGLQDGVIRPTSPYGLPLDATTMAQMMAGAGYATHMVGKWHLGFYKQEYTPTSRGFDSFFGYLLGAEDYFQHNRSYNGVHGYDLRNNTAPVSTEGGHYSTTLFTSVAESIIDNHDATQPLFLYLPYQAVHAPLQVPERYKDEFKGVSPPNRLSKVAMVAAMDEGISNITQTLAANGMLNDTIIIFSTDNGGPWPEGNNSPLRGRKATLWEGGVRGTGFVWGSALLSPSQRGAEYNGLMHVTDWMPTLASIAGTKAPANIDGIDQSQQLAQGGTSPRTEILHNIDPVGCKLTNFGVCGAVRVGDFKLSIGHEIAQSNTWKPLTDTTSGSPTVDCGSKQPAKVPKDDCSNTDSPCLFNIAVDPCEHHDLSASMPEKVTELLAKLASYNATMVPPQQLTHPPDPTGANPENHGGFWSPWQ